MAVLGITLAQAGCGSDDADGGDGGPGLRVERFEGTRGPEVIVYVAKPADNVPATARGATRVRLRCLDRRKRVVMTRSHPWPFTDTDGGLTEAHVHQRVPRARADRVRRCELVGTRKRMTGIVADPSV